MSKSMVHLNGNILCVIDTETTGLRPFYHDICEIAIVPLTSELKPNKDILPFHTLIRPRHEDRIDPDAMTINKQNMLTIMKHGMDSFRAADMFEEWFQRLGLGVRKKISPLAQNWRYDWAFIADWLGYDNMDYFFDGRYRDTMCSALFMNDYCDFHIENVPFPKVNLQYLSSQLRVPRDRAHEALHDCIITGEIYRLMLRDSIIELPFHKFQDAENMLQAEK